MDDITRRDPVKITAEDINPRYNWGRHLPVLGTMGVDFRSASITAACTATGSAARRRRWRNPTSAR